MSNQLFVLQRSRSNATKNASQAEAGRWCCYLSDWRLCEVAQTLQSVFCFLCNPHIGLLRGKHELWLQMISIRKNHENAWIPKPQQEHFNCRSFSLSPLKQAAELKANPGKNAPVWAFWTSFISSQSMSMWLWTLEMTLINYAWIVYCKSYASWMMMWLKFLEQLHQKKLHSYKKKYVDAHWLSSTKKDILV